MKSPLRITLYIAMAMVLLTLLLKDKIARLHFALRMFSGAEQVERFRAVEKYFPTRVIEPPEQPSLLISGEPILLPTSYVFDREVRETEVLLEETDATGLMVVQRDTLVFEAYYRGNTAASHTIGWSVTKSFVSALMGIAIQEGAVGSVEGSVHDYLPEMVGTAYEDVSIKNLLQMSSGVSWDEDYSNFNSDINRFGRTLALGRPFAAFVKTLDKELDQGVYNRYNSADTQVLGMIIARATGETLSDYLESRLWRPLGMENRAWWLVDDQGHEFAAAGLSASLRDYARFGLLFLHEGQAAGQQIIPAEWVRQSTTPDAPHLMPGPNEQSNNVLGYGYQWWVLDGDEGEYAALGIYNQLIYVNPTRDIVIVKSSANSNYGVTNDESSFREQETIALLRAIVESIW